MKKIDIGDTVGYESGDSRGYRSGVVVSIDGDKIWATFSGPLEGPTYLRENRITTLIKKNEWIGAPR